MTFWLVLAGIVVVTVGMAIAGYIRAGLDTMETTHWWEG